MPDAVTRRTAHPGAVTVPDRVLLAADSEATGLWSIGPGGHCGLAPATLLDTGLVSELQAWNDSADHVFGAPEVLGREARAAFWRTAGQLAVRVQARLGDDVEVLWSVAEPDWCFRWVRRPRAWRSP